MKSFPAMKQIKELEEILFESKGMIGEKNSRKNSRKLTPVSQFLRKIIVQKGLLDPDSLTIFVSLPLVFIAILLLSFPAEASDFSLKLPPNINRQWIGPEFWANRLEDWRVAGGKIENLTASSNCYLYVLTREIKSHPETNSDRAEISFKVSVPSLPSRPRTRNYVGWRLGIKGPIDDYRSAAVAGQGMEVGVTTEGLLFIGDLESVSSEELQENVREALKEGIELKLRVEPGNSGFRVGLKVLTKDSEKVLDELEDGAVPSEKIGGGLALISSLTEVRLNGQQPVSTFDDLKLFGGLFKEYEQRAFGPVVLSLYTLSQNTLKLSAQLIPGSLSDQSKVSLEVQENGKWEKIADGGVDKDSWTAEFKIPGWKTDHDFDYRIAVVDKELGYAELPHYYGKIRKEPVDKKQLIMALLSNNNEEGFPHSELVANLEKQNPDIVCFAGNQIYGRPASFWHDNVLLDKLRQEYLRQWILFGWAFSELLKDRPAILIPDARDFFQQKLWGDGGKGGLSLKIADPIAAEDSGGFLLPAEFVRLVLKTQTTHLPDSPGPEIPGLGIKPYYSEVKYGGLSLAIIDDRTFKSAPQPLLPDAQIRNGWALNRDLDLKKYSRVQGAELLGRDQLNFLEQWAADWSSGVWMKAALSSSLWVSLITMPEGWLGDEALFRLPLVKLGEFPPDDQPVADFNTGGWPPSARDEAVKILRKALAVHLAGSGGPASSLKYGLGKSGEGGWAFIASPIINSWPARWFPSSFLQAAKKSVRKTETQISGRFEDALSNKFTLEAISNPFASEGPSVYRAQPGYGIIRFDRETRQIIFENWPTNVDPSAAQAKPYPGWPLTISQAENDGRQPVSYLPLFKFKGLENPVVQVVEEKSGEILYTLRIRGTEYRPGVYRVGRYLVRCGEPGTSNWKEIKNLNSLPAGVKKIQIVEFPSNQSRS
ncbi:MAG: hypothetical protein ACP5P6_09560 [Candidatus Saccharicenans sp.]